MKIPAESIAIHGISDDDVAGAPKFVEVFDRIANMINESEVIAGYNVQFDLKVLLGECARHGKFIDLQSKHIWDMQRIFFHHEPRNLSAAYKFYCNGDHSGAHRAIHDVEVTIDIFKAQMERYQLNMEDEEVLNYAELKLPIDSNGAFVFNDTEQIELTFGKHKGKIASAKSQEIKSYLAWMTNANFPEDTKTIARAILKGRTVTRSSLPEILKSK